MASYNQAHGTFYKYRFFDAEDSESRGYLQDSLLNQHIWYASPNDLNDPFDCRQHFTFDGDPREKRKVIEQAWEEGAANQGITGLSKKEISKHVSEVMARLNDPQYRQNSFFEHIESTTGVCCMSYQPTIATQWAYYGGNHSGVCLGFEFAGAESPVYEVCYSEERPVHNLLDILSDTGDYKTNALMEVVTTKSSIWSHEQEVRALSMKPNTLGIAPLKEVIFGLNTSPENIEWTKFTINAGGHNPDYYKIEVEDGTFNLRKTTAD